MGQQMGHDVPTGDGQMSYMHMNGEVVQSLPVFGMQHPLSGGGVREEIQEQLSGLFHASQYRVCIGERDIAQKF